MRELSLPPRTHAEAVGSETHYATETIVDVKIVDKIKPISTAGWFCGCEELTTINLSNLDTSNVTDMSMMFAGCYRLQKIDLSKFDTSKVTNMHSMFLDCHLLFGVEIDYEDELFGDKLLNLIETGQAKGIDISNFNTSNVTDISAMFESTVVPRFGEGTTGTRHT